MPITSPFMLNSGPPELPRLIAASVWMKSSYGPWLDVAAARRDDAGGHRAAQPERVADRQHPVAHPLVVAVAELNRRQRLVRFHLQQRDVARSSRPTTVGLQRGLSCRVTVIFVGALDHVVVGHHQAGRVDDEARAEDFASAARARGCWRCADPGGRPGRLRLRKSLKNCSNGEPGGNIGISGPQPPRACTEVEDETLTTAGSSCSARSAKLSGAPRA